MKTVLGILMLAMASDASDAKSYSSESSYTKVLENSKVTPVQKVIQMMEDMIAKSTDEMNKDEVTFAAFKTFCDNTANEKNKAITDATEKIEVLKADIFAFAEDAETLATEISGHDADIAVWEGDQKAAKSVRAIEKADYDAAHKDYTESIDALGRAIDVLKKNSGKIAQLQIDQHITVLKTSNLIPPEAKRVIDAFIQQGSGETAALDAPEANAYESQSKGIIDMLQGLLDKFTAELTDLEKTESESVHEFMMLSQDLENNIQHATEARDIAQKTKASKLQAKADAEGSLQDTTTTMKEDQKVLSDLIAQCEQKGSDFAKKQQLRKEEIEAINKAIDIVSGGAVKGNSEKHLPQLVQTSTAIGDGAALAQLRSDTNSPTRKRLVSYLRDRANEMNSRLLSALAVRVEADPFKKIKKMIKDLITKLLEEANEEATHKGWCDVELGTNKQTRDEKTEAVVTLTAEIDELSASIAKLTEEVTELMQQVADIDAAVAKATGIREAEKAKNQVTISDSQEAQKAVAQALTVLREFYAKAAQSDVGDAAQSDSSTGVIGMLEVIESDFARVEAETKTAEDLAQKEYDEFMTDSEVDKTEKTSDIEHKNKLKQDQSQSMEEKKADLEGTQKELDAALDYYEKLKPSCVDSGESFEDRVKRREEEIQSLKEALQILNGEDIR